MNEVNQQNNMNTGNLSTQDVNSSVGGAVPPSDPNETSISFQMPETTSVDTGTSASTTSDVISSDTLVVPSFPEVPEQVYVDSSTPSIDSPIVGSNDSSNVSPIENVSPPTTVSASQSSSTLQSSSVSQPSADSSVSTTQPNTNLGGPEQPNVDSPQSSQTGGSIPPTDNYSNTSSVGMSSYKNNYDTLIAEFIGPNYEKFFKRFNFSAFFFTTFYFAYRKMYLYALIEFSLFLFISHFFESSMISSWIFELIWSILIGIILNPLYRHFVKRKVRKIIWKNPDKSFEELREICIRKGGRSILSIFIWIAIYIAIVCVITAISILFEFSFSYFLFYTLLNLFQIAQNSTTPMENPTYEGVLSYDTAVIMDDEFTMSVPSVFTDNSDYYNYDYSFESGNGVFDECSAQLVKVDNFYQADNLITQMAQYHNSETGSNTAFYTTVNDIEWYWFSNTDSFGTTYYYATSQGNQLYLFTYEEQESADTSCDSYREEILNSIQRQ